MALLALGCVRLDTNPPFDTTPRISFVGVSFDTMVEFQDSFIISIAYEDGDGDLGNADPDINTIFIQDSRLSQPDEYYLAPLAPDGAEIPIQGQLNIQLSPTFLLGNGDFETTVFSLYVVDRAGRQSNTVQTNPILILRE